MIEYRLLDYDEITRDLFADFDRKQIVTKCRRKIDGQWQIVDAPFIDDWSESNYAEYISCIKNTVETGGFLCAAFADGKLKGAVSVESEPIGRNKNYLDLSAIHVSSDMRGQGIGRGLFTRAAAWARGKGAEKLYISAHSSVESQDFYAAMGCVDAEEYNAEHVEEEPFDCQLEYKL